MAESVIDICNHALALIDDNPINTLDEATDKAKRCNTFWPTVRRTILRMHPWNCAIKRVELAALQQAPVFGYGSQFNLPADCLRVLEVYENTDYKIEGRKILTDATAVSLKYIYDNKEVSMYDALLDEVMAAYLAHKLAKTDSKKQEMWEIFKALLPMAKNIDAQEEPQDSVDSFPLIDVRSR